MANHHPAFKHQKTSPLSRPFPSSIPYAVRPEWEWVFWNMNSSWARGRFPEFISFPFATTKPFISSLSNFYLLYLFSLEAHWYPFSFPVLASAQFFFPSDLVLYLYLRRPLLMSQSFQRIYTYTQSLLLLWIAFLSVLIKSLELMLALVPFTPLLFPPFGLLIFWYLVLRYIDTPLPLPPYHAHLQVVRFFVLFFCNRLYTSYVQWSPPNTYLYFITRLMHACAYIRNRSSRPTTTLEEPCFCRMVLIALTSQRSVFPSHHCDMCT